MRGLIKVWLVLIFSLWLGLVGIAGQKVICQYSPDGMVLRWRLLSQKDGRAKVYRWEGGGWKEIGEVGIDWSRAKGVLGGEYPVLQAYFDGRLDEKKEALFLAGLYARSFVDKDLAQVLGLVFIDPGVEQGKSYRYKVVFPSGEVELDSCKAIIPKRRTFKVGSTVKMREIGLYWDGLDRVKVYRIKRDGQDLYPFGYIPLVKDGKVWFWDRGLEEEKEYEYEVIGFDFGFNQWSGRIKVYLPDLTPPPPSTGLKVLENGSSSVKLGWEAVNDKIKGYYLWKKGPEDGEFKKASSLLKKTEFVDRAVRPGQAFLYAVSAVDEAGNESDLSDPILVVVKDDIPPQKVAGLKSAIEPGQVHLSWQANREEDLWAYRVWRRIGEGKFVLIGPKVEGEDFVDRLPKTLDEKDITYKVEAMDTSNNASDPALITVRLPDVTPPPVPLILNHSWMPDKGELVLKVRWAGDSEELGVRLVIGSKEIEKKVKVSDLEDENLRLTKIEPGRYKVFLWAIDEAGNKSREFEYAVLLPAPEKEGKILLKVEKRKDKHFLSWRIPKGYTLALSRRGGILKVLSEEEGKVEFKPSSGLEVLVYDGSGKVVESRELK